MHRVGAKAFRLFFQVEDVPRCTPSLLAPSCDEDGVTVRPHPSSSPTSTVTWKNGSTPILPGSPPAEFSSCHHPGTRSAGDASPSSWSSDAGRQSAKACEAIQPALPDHADGFLVRNASSGQEGIPDGAVGGTPPPRAYHGHGSVTCRPGAWPGACDLRAASQIWSRRRSALSLPRAATACSPRPLLP